MSEEYDIILDAKKRVNEPHNKSYENAKILSEAGKLKQVNKIILEPYEFSSGSLPEEGPKRFGNVGFWRVLRMCLLKIPAGACRFLP